LQRGAGVVGEVDAVEVSPCRTWVTMLSTRLSDCFWPGGNEDKGVDEEAEEDAGKGDEED